ncbi:unnamed protein product [Amoebophrya sp. A120]|nr:unnamed protein product [Amoebophrya sp. A120]|eukprot:GSA120T00009472001.1
MDRGSIAKAVVNKQTKKAKAKQDRKERAPMTNKAIEEALRGKGHAVNQHNIAIYRRLKGNLQKVGKHGHTIMNLFNKDKDTGNLIWDDNKVDGYWATRTKKIKTLPWKTMGKRLTKLYNDLAPKEKLNRMPFVFLAMPPGGEQLASESPSPLSGMQDEEELSDASVAGGGDDDEGEVEKNDEVSSDGLSEELDFNEDGDAFDENNSSVVVEQGLLEGAGEQDVVEGGDAGGGDVDMMDVGFDDGGNSTDASSGLQQLLGGAKVMPSSSSSTRIKNNNLDLSGNSASSKQNSSSTSLGGALGALTTYSNSSSTNINSTTTEVECRHVVPKVVTAELWEDDELQQMKNAVHAMCKSIGSVGVEDVAPLFKFAEHYESGMMILEKFFRKGWGLEIFAEQTYPLRAFKELQWLAWCDYNKPGFRPPVLANDFPAPSWLSEHDAGMQRAMDEAEVLVYTEVVLESIRSNKIEDAKQQMSMIMMEMGSSYQLALQEVASTRAWMEFLPVQVMHIAIVESLKKYDLTIVGENHYPSYLMNDRTWVNIGVETTASDLIDAAHEISNMPKAQVPFEEFHRKVSDMLSKLVETAMERLESQVDAVLNAKTYMDLHWKAESTTVRKNLEMAVNVFEKGSVKHDRAARAIYYCKFQEGALSEEATQAAADSQLLATDFAYKAAMDRYLGYTRITGEGKNELDKMLNYSESDWKAEQDTDILTLMIDRADKFRATIPKFLAASQVSNLAALSNNISDELIQRKRNEKVDEGKKKAVRSREEKEENKGLLPATKNQKKEQKERLENAKRLAKQEEEKKKNAAASSSSSSSNVVSRGGGSRNKDLFLEALKNAKKK